MRRADGHRIVTIHTARRHLFYEGFAGLRSRHGEHEMAVTSSAASAREAMPDRLRGIALLGIVVVNAPYFALSNEGFTTESVASTTNAVTAFMVFMFAQGKFYLLFSFLFGYSAAFILRDNSKPNRRRFIYRLIALLLIGVAHAVFFFIGDILITYALLGFALLLLSRRSNKALITWSGISAAVGVLLLLLVVAASVFVTEPDPAVLNLDRALMAGTFLEAAAARMELLPTVVLSVLLVQGPMAFAAFLLGLLASRRRLLADPSTHRQLWKRLMLFGLGIGIPVQVVAAWLQISALRGGDLFTFDGAIGVFIGFTTAPVLTAGYIGLLGWALTKRESFMSWAAPAGRASLSVYIGESVVLSLLFSGYGLGFFDRWGALPVVLAGIASWLVLSATAHLWLRKFSRGPLEIALMQTTSLPQRR